MMTDGAGAAPVIDVDDVQARLVAGHLLGQADGAPMVSVSQADLAGLTGLTVRTLRRVLDRLVAAGWVTVASEATPNSPAVWDVTMLEAAGVVPERPREEVVAPAPSTSASGGSRARVVDEESVAGVEVGEHLLVPPALLDGSGPNVPRGGDLGLTREFLESCRGGIDHELAAWLDMGGHLVVDDGHRRLAAALELGLPLVPVHVVEQASEVERLAFQVRSNDQHCHNSPAGRAAAGTQMVLMGASTAQMARAGFSVAEQKASRALARNEAVRRRAVEAPSVDLVTLGALAALEEEGSHAHEVVEKALSDIEARPSQAEHHLELARIRVTACRCVAAREEELRSAGVRVLDELPDLYGKGAKAALLSGLDIGAGDLAGGALVAEHARTCPGHAVYVQFSGAAEETMADARRTYDTVVCTDWAGYGHRNRYATARSGATSGPQSEEQKSQARRVREMNRAMDAANTVRRRWLSESLLSRSSAPQMALHVIAVIMLRQTHSTGSYPLSQIAEKLGVVRDWSEQGSTATATRALLAETACLAEVMVDKSSWDLDRWSANHAEIVRLWLRACERWGYCLSDVERGLCEQVEADEDLSLCGVSAPRRTEAEEVVA